MDKIEDFKIEVISVVCPACEKPFATGSMSYIPPVTASTPIEADLHRVLPHPYFRSALLGTCPHCLFTWWLSSFAPHYVLPEWLEETPDIDLCKKFAHAVLTGRKHGYHALDRALLALNGAWCAQEAESDHIKFLELAKKELAEALADDSWEGNRGRYNYIMGEVLRLLKDFHGAVKHFELVDRRSMLPRELVEHQRLQAVAGDSRPTKLPPHIVEEIFVPYEKRTTTKQPAAVAPVVPVNNFAPVQALR